MSAVFTESVVEEAALAWLEGLGWTVTHQPDIALGALRAKGAGRLVARAA